MNELSNRGLLPPDISKEDKTMRKTIVNAGTQIDTIDGYLIVTDINDAGLVYCDEYTEDEDDPEKFNRETAMLTKSDIEHRMKEVDGMNHTVILERGNG